MPTGVLPYRNTVAVLATMHGKEQVIGPLLEQGLGLRVGVAMGLDTDRFGAFCRETERAGSPLDAARAKIAAGFDYAPYARVGIASEGSFGPHPGIPFLGLGRELVLLIDRERGLELAGHFATFETNYGHVVVTNAEAARAFADRSGFPEHGLIVTACVDGKPAPGLALIKDIADAGALEGAVDRVVSRCGSAFVETDMRAHRNPSRMRAIGQATSDLVRRFLSCCPVCGRPGFDVSQRIAGLPCSCCGEPTHLIRAEVLTCQACDHRQERSGPVGKASEPSHCQNCNP